MYSNRELNCQIKRIARMCGIERRFVFHMAHHTFATVALAHSISIESVAKMLGHSRTDPRGTKYFIVYLLGNYQ